ncbi:inosine/xanthosine triphosphatase [Candidatus Alkanophaga liquidiphilum]|nr:Non-canonicalNTP pyrophosphatase [Candidatus Alkanophaga liquidiphilum]
MRVRVAVGSNNPVKIKAVERAFSHFYNAVVESVAAPSGVSRQPFGDDTIKGAVNRATFALKATASDLGVGIEAGLFPVHGTLTGYVDVQWCAIADRYGRITLGCGPGFEHPPPIIRRVLEGVEVGDAMETLTGIRDIGANIGAVGFLTKSILTRETITEHCVLMALIPRINKELYW